MKNYMLLLFSLVLLSSCIDSLDDIPGSKEKVNGFEVTWRTNVSESKRNVIRDILNDMQYVQGGMFLMGATQEQELYARENERPAHYVKIPSYYICKNEISAEQVEILTDMELTTYEKKNGAPKYKWSDWRHVIDLIGDYASITMDFPTEAQWEYAARGGAYGKGYVYSGGNDLSEAANEPNELGLFGMARCHSEWCKDAYNAYSGKPLEIDPYRVQGVGHVVRGGNVKSTEDTKYYFSSYLSRDGFYNCYKDIRTCRVSARSYCVDSWLYLGVYISCRFVINLN